MEVTWQKLLIVATVCAIAAFLILVLRLAHPHHRILALVIYGFGWIPFLLSIWKLRVAFPDQAGQFLQWQTHILVGIGFFVVAWVLLVLIPANKSSLLDIEISQLPQRIETDLQHLDFIDDKLQSVVLAIGNHHWDDESQLSSEESLILKKQWVRFIEANFELDLLKSRYSGFYQVNGFSHPEIHAQAFLIAYGAHVSQYLATLLVTAKISGQMAAKTLLNDTHLDHGLPAGSFARVQGMVSHPNEILRLNAGRAYLLLMRSRLEDNGAAISRIEEQIRDIEKLVSDDFGLFVKNPLDILEHHASHTWFPVQKGVALGMASVRTVSRDYFISRTQIEEEIDNFLPGDILLTRREWHLTNLGIPGYWSHAALHIGTLEDLDKYFFDVDGIDGKTPSGVIRERFPNVYTALDQTDDAGARPAVIHALRPGVIVESIQAVAIADSLAVLRPRVSKSDRWQAVLAALVHFGKPYNYQFDFRTESALLCSQLIYKAYEQIDSIRLQPKINNGRLLLSPNEIAIKFDQEADLKDSELDFVLFLDGITVGRTIKRSADDFRTSWSRPKWHIVFQES